MAYDLWKGIQALITPCHEKMPVYANGEKDVSNHIADVFSLSSPDHESSPYFQVCFYMY